MKTHEDTGPLGFRLGADPAPFTIAIPELGQEALRVDYLSFVDLWVEVGADHGAAVGDGVQLQLPGAQAMRWRIQEVSQGDGVPRLRLAGDQSLDEARHLARLTDQLAHDGRLSADAGRVARLERFHDPERVRSALRAIKGSRRGALLRLADGRETRVLSVDDLGPERHPIRWQLEAPLDSATLPATVVFVGYNSVCGFGLNRARVEGDLLLTELPRWCERKRHRWHRRAPAADGLTVSFTHPCFAGLTIERPLTDLSLAGFGFRTPPAEDLLFPGLTLHDVTLKREGRPLLRAAALVRQILRGDGDAVCGVEIVGLADDGERRWHRLVIDALHPHTRAGGVWSADSWDVYERSGYFSLSGKCPQYFSRLRQPFARTCRKLDRTRRMSVHTVWPEDDGVSASLSLLKVHTHTWMAYQLAKSQRPDDPVHGGEILRELYYRSYEHAMLDPNLRWTMGYVHLGERFSRRVHVDFPARFLDGAGRADIRRFRAIEVQSDFEPPIRAVTNPVRVEPATDGDEALLHDVLSRTRTAAYREALDLTPEQFWMTDLIAEMTGAGLSRSRGLLIARRHGEPIAAVVMESAEEGIHLFGLLDITRIFNLTSEPLTEHEVARMLQAAGAWYRDRNKEVFVLFDEDDLVEPSRSAYVQDMGYADLAILSTALVPDLLEHVLEVTSPRRLPALEKTHA